MAARLQLVVPCHNEAGNLRALVDELHRTLAPLAISYEIIVTDDASTDDSWDVLKDLAGGDEHLRLQRFAANCGESAASWAGMQSARGRTIVTIDADLQNDPADIPRLLARLRDVDCVCGSRLQSRAEGDGLVRRVSSRVANWVRMRLSADGTTDAGCTYRAFRRECIANVHFFKGMHRFLPTLIRMEGFTVGEIPVANRPRTSGRSHYGIGNRAFASLADLLAVRWMKSRSVAYRIEELFEPALDPARGDHP